MKEEDLIKLIRQEVEKYVIKNDIKEKSIETLGDDKLLENDLKKEFTINKNSDDLIVMELSINELEGISRGIYINENSEIILNYLLNNKNIYVIEEGISWKKYKNINIALEKQYIKYEEKLKLYGIEICKRVDIKNKLLGKTLCIRDGVIDLKFIKNQDLEIKEIEIEKKVYVTELAKEYIRQQSIKIKRR